MSAADLDARLAAAREVATSVAHEGRVLYPYRPDAQKNRWRWQFGIVWPRGWATHVDAEPWWCRGAFLVVAPRAGGAHARVEVHWARLVPGRLDDGTRWDLPEERRASVTIALDDDGPTRLDLGDDCWAIVETQRAEPIGDDEVLHVVEVRIENTRTGIGAPPEDRDDNLLEAMIGAQVLLASDARVVSSRVGPVASLPGARRARAERLWTVVVDEHAAIAAPIILPEPPVLAPAATGDSGDGLEIEEMMALRVRTLLPEERDAAQHDPMSAAVEARDATIDEDELVDLHAAMTPRTLERRTVSGRAVEDASASVGGLDVGVGQSVVLRPRPAGPGRGIDTLDVVLAGRRATVVEVREDLDGTTHLAVVVDDDPGADLQREAGRHFHFRLDEVESVPDQR